MKHTTIVPDRRFVASVTLPEGVKFTTTIYGPTASAAENAYLEINPRVTVVARMELR